MNERILVVDDEEGMRLALREVLTRRGYQLELAQDGREALERLRQPAVAAPPVDLALSDVRMPLMNGLELLQAVRELPAAPPMIIMTAFGTIEDAVEAMRLGARDYILKPFSPDAVEAAVERALKECRPARGDSSKQAAEQMEQVESGDAADANDAELADGAGGRLNGGLRPGRFIAVDESMKRLREVAAEVAASDASILILGESGTGKEVLARFIHQHSLRKDGPFVAVNCAAVPETLLESELFGHLKGSFTGALIDRKGHFELAQRGTLLLDEISEMPLALQAKLLRVLQEREITPVGADRPTRLDIRVIATSNRPLEQSVADGAFREDLYYRLNVISLELPPLRMRRGDVLPLAEFFVRRHCRRNRRDLKQISRELERYLLEQHWKGNVRELENFLERAVLLCKEPLLKPENIFLTALCGAYGRPAFEPRIQVLNGKTAAVRSEAVGVAGDGCVKPEQDPRAPEGRLDYGAAAPQPDLAAALETGPTMTLEEMERQLILSTLEKVNGNRTRAADLLGVSVRTIRNKLNQYNLPLNV